MRFSRWNGSAGSRKRRTWGGNSFARREPLCGSIAAGQPAPAARRRHHIADQARDAIGIERPVGRLAETGDHETLGWNHDDILPDRALGEESIERPAMFDAVLCATAVAEIGPEAGAV